MRAPVLRPTCAGLYLLVVVACQSGTGGAAPDAPAELGYQFAEVRRPMKTGEAERLSDVYPELFAALEASYDADLRAVRADLVRSPADARSYDALNAVAVVFFELHRRAEGERAGGGGFLADNLRATKVMAVSWRAYGDVQDRRLRGAILDFFEDLLLGNKSGMRAARGRFTPTVESLLKWERDSALIERIETIVASATVLDGRAR